MDKLLEAVALLEQVDVLIQDVLPASNYCYELHCKLQNLVDEITDIAPNMLEEV